MRKDNLTLAVDWGQEYLAAIRVCLGDKLLITRNVDLMEEAAKQRFDEEVGVLLPVDGREEHLAAMDAFLTHEYESRREHLARIDGNGHVGDFYLEEDAIKLEAVSMLPFRPFPLGAFPAELRTCLARVSASIGCDPSYPGLTLLAAAAGAIGNSRVIELREGWTEPAVVWTAIIGDSGTQKSPAARQILRIVHRKQEKAAEEYAAAMQAYERNCKRYKETQAEFKELKRRDPAVRDSEQPEPIEPTLVSHFTNDATVEALGVLLKRNPRGLLLAVDELGSWFGSFNQYKQKGGGDVSRWLSAYDADTWNVDRVTRGNLFIRRAAISITGGTQPGTLKKLVGNEHVTNGLCARFLFAMPDSDNRPKVWSDDLTIPHEVRQKIYTALNGLWGLTMDNTTGDDGCITPTPRKLHLSPAAKERWAAFYARHSEEARYLTGYQAAVHSKLEGACARLAMVLYLLKTSGTLAGQREAEGRGGDVDLESMEAAITLVDWCEHEAARVHRLVAGNVDEDARRALAGVIEKLGGSCTIRELQRKMHRKYPTAAAVKLDLSGLVFHGYGVLEGNRFTITPRLDPEDGQV